MDSHLGIGVRMMGIFRRKARDPLDTRTRGLRFTEKLLPVFGPAQVGDSTKPIRPVTDAEAARDALMQESLERVVASDGTVYFVERTS